PNTANNRYEARTDPWNIRKRLQKPLTFMPSIRLRRILCKGGRERLELPLLRRWSDLFEVSSCRWCLRKALLTPVTRNRRRNGRERGRKEFVAARLRTKRRTARSRSREPQQENGRTKTIKRRTAPRAGGVVPQTPAVAWHRVWRKPRRAPRARSASARRRGH